MTDGHANFPRDKSRLASWENSETFAPTAIRAMVRRQHGIRVPIRETSFCEYYGQLLNCDEV